jgi:hypothetical protein
MFNAALTITVALSSDVKIGCNFISSKGSQDSACTHVSYKQISRALARGHIIVLLNDNFVKLTCDRFIKLLSFGSLDDPEHGHIDEHC